MSTLERTVESAEGSAEVGGSEGSIKRSKNARTAFPCPSLENKAELGILILFSLFLSSTSLEHSLLSCAHISALSTRESASSRPSSQKSANSSPKSAYIQETDDSDSLVPTKRNISSVPTKRTRHYSSVPTKRKD